MSFIENLKQYSLRLNVQGRIWSRFKNHEVEFAAIDIERIGSSPRSNNEWCSKSLFSKDTRAKPSPEQT